jgi:hypothetical protein
MDLAKLAAEMIETAHTLGYGPIPDTRPYARDIDDLFGYHLRVIFTIDKIMAHELNHLSVGGTLCGLQVPNRVIAELAQHFFEGEFWEMPSSGLHRSGTVRHFTDNPHFGNSVGRKFEFDG